MLDSVAVFQEAEGPLRVAETARRPQPAAADAALFDDSARQHASRVPPPPGAPT